MGRHDEWEPKSVPPPATAKANPGPKTINRPAVHIVRRGETLYAIAWRYALDYRQVAKWNGLAPPYRIHPGRRLRMVVGGGTLPDTSPGPRVVTAPREVPKVTPRPSPTNPEDSQRDAPTPSSTVPQWPDTDVARWQWPTQGKVVGSFAQSGGNGINISGRASQTVYAAAAGRVVYSGSGLIGYGELIILKHNKQFLSAYAHNNKRLVKEGDVVAGGDPIARMGRTGIDRVMLHFEIRRDGKPVDPRAYLPR